MMFEKLWSVLHQMNFPADKRKILQHAREAKVNDRLMEYLNKLPDRTYNTLFEVQEAIPPTNNLLSLLWRIK